MTVGWITKLAVVAAIGVGCTSAGSGDAPRQSPAPPPPPPPPPSAPAAIMGAIVGTNVTWGDRYNRGDAVALAGMYTADAVLMTPEGDVVGSEAIRRHFERLFSSRPDSVLSSKVATETLDVAGDRAYEAGTVVYSLVSRRAPGRPREAQVRYINFWQATPDGRWLIRRSLRSE